MTELSMKSAAIRTREWKQKNPERWREHQIRYCRKIRKPCQKCNGSMPYPSQGAKYCSDQCRKAVNRMADVKRRAKLRRELELYKINLGCSRCGYSKCGAALDFHHPDKNKERRITVRSWKSKLGRIEIEKCILLCSNCHREEHHMENGDVYPRELIG